MAQNSHNMAIFPHFLAFLVTFLVVRTTFMRLTSTERTQRPVTHAVWWCWTIWTIVKHSSGVGWVQNMAIFMAKTFLVTFLVVRTTFMQLTSTERTQRPVTHTEWWCWTIWTIVKHSSGVGWVQNMAIFMAKTTPRWLGCSRLDRPTWKVSSGSYHTPMHVRACLRTILVHSRHLSRVPGVQKWLFLWLKPHQDGWAAPG